SMRDQPRPRSGVYAVRQGGPLAINLRRHVMGMELQPYRPQKHSLALISTGNRYAIASRGPWSLEGAWLWSLKDRIDRRWMEGYQRLSPMRRPEGADLWARVNPGDSSVGGRELTEMAPAMRCGGCGAKVGADILRRVLDRLQIAPRSEVWVGLGASEDASALCWPEGRLLVQSVDFFRAFLDDPYLVGRIAAVHGLSDVFAKGAVPHSALAMAALPHGSEAAVEEQLFQLLSGAAEVFREEKVTLIGGHTAEGSELALGFTVNATMEPGGWLGKGGLQGGEVLVLTKALGTGVILAADMQGRAAGRAVDAAVTSMMASNRGAAECLRRHGVTGCTDVTGFGLAGHLAEMLEASGRAARIDLDALPAIPGATEAIGQGIVSTMHGQNVRGRRWIDATEAQARHPAYPLLFDPQTSGGLLAGVPASRAGACLEDLRHAGFAAAAVVGEVEEGSTEGRRIRLA
ncbi:MAG: selenide, water dikinase SelD, partial [Nitrospira sp.]|nr:selenide, water dikinase SelD [Nitrospira sp.]